MASSLRTLFFSSTIIFSSTSQLIHMESKVQQKSLNVLIPSGRIELTIISENACNFSENRLEVVRIFTIKVADDESLLPLFTKQQHHFITYRTSLQANKTNTKRTLLQIEPSAYIIIIITTCRRALTSQTPVYLKSCLLKTSPSLAPPSLSFSIPFSIPIH